MDGAMVSGPSPWFRCMHDWVVDCDAHHGGKGSVYFYYIIPT